MDESSVVTTWRLETTGPSLPRAAQAACERIAAQLKRRGAQLAGPREGTPDVRLVAAVSPGAAESFAIEKTPGAAPVVQVIGADARGLSYGLFELAGQLGCAADGRDAFAAVEPCHRTPQIGARSVNVFLHNRQLEEEWLYSRDYWERYFALLAESRFNMFTLSYGHQTSYLSPPFPFLVETPGYERVRTPEYGPEDRRRNLDALRMIAGLAHEWGLTFVLGIWQQHAHTYGRNYVEGLAYDDLFDYCPKALAVLLKECPGIEGVQFRVNSESGINEDHQARFFGAMLKTLRDAGREFWVDMRAKGLRAETVAAAGELGMKVNVSTKFWTEHMALPHFAGRTNPADANQYRRYGYWDLLPRGRPYGMVYQLWTVGTQKVLLWGDMEHARRFTRSCVEGDGAGFEVFAPLTNKGYGNLPGGRWHALTPGHEYTDWEFERYWAFFMAFGLGGYSGAERQPVYASAFRDRFGSEADAVRRAYDAAGGILPLVTAFHSCSASTFGYWTEMDTGGTSDIYPLVPTGDVSRLQDIREYVANLIAGTPSGKTTPPEIADRLTALAAATEAALAEAGDATGPEIAATRRDFRVQCALARYHALRIRSAVAWTLFRRTADRQRLREAVAGAEGALAEWERVVALTDGVYYGHMIFIQAERQVGHWKDLLPFLRHDVERLRRVEELFTRSLRDPAAAVRASVPAPWYEYERKWRIENGTPHHTPGGLIPAKPPEIPQYGLPKHNLMQDPVAVVAEVLRDTAAGGIGHAPPETVAAGRPFPLRATLVGDAGGAVVHWRRAGGAYAAIVMTPDADGLLSAVLPPPADGATTEYYIEATARDGRLFRHGTPDQPHRVTAGMPGRKPVVTHREIARCRPGADLAVRAEVRSALPLALLRLHYRRRVQSEDWLTVDMAPVGGAQYEGVIPGAYITSEWDMMYAVEAVDVSGAGGFHPDQFSRAPYVIVRVEG